jgi:hypothetical protein
MLSAVFFRFSILALGVCTLTAALALAAQSRLHGRVVDENGSAVAGATIKASADGAPAAACTSDETGRFSLEFAPGVVELRVDKVGYYAFAASHLLNEGAYAPLEIVLNHRQEFEEMVSVTYSTPQIDASEAAVQNTITSEQIQELPFSATHDFRNALPLLPGVYKDNQGRIHMNGGAENQALYTLDGFNLTSPVSGVLENKISVDAVRAVRIDTSRYSAAHGKGSAGVLSLETARGDDRFRFSSTNFLPSFEFHDGLKLSNWNPRFSFSGPIAKGRAWFFNALDAQYDLNVVDDLPSGLNTSRNWVGSNLTRLQLNVTPRNIVSLGFLFNFQEGRHLGLSALDPLETSRNRRERLYFINVKDQAFLDGGWVLDTGIALNRMNSDEFPMGASTYVISPAGRSGNYFRQSHGRVERLQFMSSVLTPTVQWSGSHSFKFGIEGNRIHYRQFSYRRPMEIRRLSGSRLREVRFSSAASFGRDNFEGSAFFEDRWRPLPQLSIDAGLRFDWDQVLKQTLAAPRLAVAWSPPALPYSKFSAGVGIFYDALNLQLLTRPLDQQRWDIFYAGDGITPAEAPLSIRYGVDERALKAGSYLNWSLSWEQSLPAAFLLRTHFVRKIGRNGWSYDLASEYGLSQSALFLLNNSRRDRYSYLEWTLSRTFAGKYPWLMSYARSSARSSAVLDFSPENPVFGRQGGGPLDWDLPNRLISWGLVPAPFLEKYNLAYFLEWHSGFPFTSVNEMQQLIGAPNSRRFPDYFSANLHVERRLRFGGREWALRAGFNNLTGHHNPMSVNNNIDSPDFGTFSGGQGRVFTGRIRLLGRN